MLDTYIKLGPGSQSPTIEYFKNISFPKPLKKTNMSLIQRVEENSTIMSLLHDFVQFLPTIYEQFSTKNSLTEEAVRDHIFWLVFGKNPSSDREAYNKTGRSDLRIKIEDHGNILYTINVEFKIWGRHGYKKLPSQPLKYMKESDEIGLVILIDQRKNPSIDDFQKIVKENTDYPCTDISDQALLETNLPYFLSFHIDNRFTNPRLIMSFVIAMPDQTETM